MKNTLLILLFLIVTIHPTFSQETPKFIENELIIWLNPEVSASNFAEKFPQQLKPKRVLSKRLNIWLFEFTQANNERVERINSFRRQPDVRYAQNNHLVKSRSITPNDSYYGQQWAPAVMDLPNAWGKFDTGGVSADGDDIVIAIIDGGFDLTHQDLKFWKNTNEIPNNGIDDDNNGYIDDYDGWNAYNSTGNIPSSDHGTHVSGIAGAKGNNGLGISGVNWDVNILPIAGSSTNEATVVEAYSYILEMRALYNDTNGQSGAFIVASNASFGVDYGDPDNFPIWCSIYNALGDEGVLNCAATANLNINVDSQGDVPTACSSNFLIGITNTNSSDSKVFGAGYGTTSIDLGSPGDGIYSTLTNNNYGFDSGTSMASPQVAGIISLMYASMCQSMIQDYKSDPANFALMVRQKLFDGADNVSSLNGLVAHGRVNALGAIESVLGLSASTSITGPASFCSNGTFTLNNLPSGASVNWSVTPSLNTSTSINGNSITVTRLNNTVSSVLITAEVTGSSGCSQTIQYESFMGVPRPIAYDDFGQEMVFVNACVNVHESITFTTPPNASQWQWTKISGNFNLQSSNNSGTIIGFQPTTGLIEVKYYSSACNEWSVAALLYINISSSCSGGFEFFSVYPNPASSELNIDMAESAFAEKDGTIEGTYQVELIRQSSLKKVYSTESSARNLKIPLNKFEEGAYFINILYKEAVIRKQIIIKR